MPNHQIIVSVNDYSECYLGGISFYFYLDSNYFLKSSIAQALCVHACSVVSDSLPPHGLQPTRLLCPWNSPVKNTGVGSHFLLLGIFPTQESNPATQVDSLLSEPPGKPLQALLQAFSLVSILLSTIKLVRMALTPFQRCS